jgi:hypothetical protein
MIFYLKDQHCQQKVFRISFYDDLHSAKYTSNIYQQVLKSANVTNDYKLKNLSQKHLNKIYTSTYMSVCNYFEAYGAYFEFSFHEN